MYLVTEVKSKINNLNYNKVYLRDANSIITILDLDTGKEIKNFSCDKYENDIIIGVELDTGKHYEINRNDIVGVTKSRYGIVTYIAHCFSLRGYRLSECLDYVDCIERYEFTKSQSKGVVYTIKDCYTRQVGRYDRFEDGIYGNSINVLDFILEYHNTLFVEIDNDYLFVYCFTNPMMQNCIRYKYKILNKSLLSKILLLG